MPKRPRRPGEADVLADVLGVLRLQGDVICRSVFRAPWGLSFPPGPGHFHVVERGELWVEASGTKAQRLSAGDLVVLPRGRGHTIADARRRRAVPFESVAGPAFESADALLRYGGDGATTKLVCGTFRFANLAAATSLEALPDVLIVAAADRPRRGLLGRTLPLLLSEAGSSEPGAELTTAHLVDIVIVHAIRRWLLDVPPGEGGWLGALRDAKLSRALGRIHAAPEHDWDVAALASEVGMSRTTFATRFTSVVGEPPLRYLTRVRMNLAMHLLSERPSPSIRELATRVGYEAEAAFSRAFKRHFGQSPKYHRTRLSSSVSGSPASPSKPR